MLYVCFSTHTHTQSLSLFSVANICTCLSVTILGLHNLSGDSYLEKIDSPSLSSCSSRGGALEIPYKGVVMSTGIIIMHVLFR